ncbi:hypothetical protein U1Q18_050492 [Sarracenia purpurea var. burkii]
MRKGSLFLKCDADGRKNAKKLPLLDGQRVIEVTCGNCCGRHRLSNDVTVLYQSALSAVSIKRLDEFYFSEDFHKLTSNKLEV